MRLLFLLLILISSLSCRKFVWDNPNDTINPKTEPASLKDGLVAYYPFNGNANDESGNGNNGIINGVLIDSNRFGYSNNSFLFNGELSNIRIPNSDKLVLNSNFTISIWLKLKAANHIFNSFVSNASSGTEAISGWVWAYSNFTNPIRIHFQAYPSSPSSAAFTLAKNGNNLLLNKWYHLTTTYDKNNSILKYYVDGILTDTFNIAYNIRNSNLDIFIGNHFANNIQQITSSSQGFNGNLDDIRFYNRALTQEEITYLANN